MKGLDNWIEGHASNERVSYRCPSCDNKWDGWAWLEHGAYSSPKDDSDKCPDCGDWGDIE